MGIFAMNKVRFSMFWKFFFITLVLSLVCLFIVYFWNQNIQKKNLVECSIDQLKYLSQFSAFSMPGEDISRVVKSKYSKRGNYDKVTSQIDQVFQFTLQQGKPYKLSLLIPEESSVKIFFSTDPQFKMMDLGQWYSEIGNAISQNAIQLKKDYFEKGHNLYSAFAPVKVDDEVIAVVRVDVEKKVILSSMPPIFPEILVYIGRKFFFPY